LEKRIQDTKNQIIGMITNSKFKTLQEEDKEKLKGDFSGILKEMEQKKNKIISFSINTTLLNLKQIIEKFEKNEKISAEALKLGLKISRLIVEKSIEEYKNCFNEKEKPLYLM